jgi:hypothetical protein
MNIHPAASRRGFQAWVRADLHPAKGRFGLIFGMHGIGKVNRFVCRQGVHQPVVQRDEVRLLLGGCDPRQGFGLAIFEAEPGQKLDAAGMGVLLSEFGGDVGPDLLCRTAEPPL